MKKNSAVNANGLQSDLAANEQRKASQYARSLIEASLDPLVTISPLGKITDVNEATIKVTGVPRLMSKRGRWKYLPLYVLLSVTSLASARNGF